MDFRKFDRNDIYKNCIVFLRSISLVWEFVKGVIKHYFYKYVSFTYFDNM